MVALGTLGATATASAAPKPIAGFIGGPVAQSAGNFTQPTEVAIYTGVDADPSNDKLFVVETVESNNNRVQRLDRHGNFELMWGKDVISSGAPGDTGVGYEICTASLTGAENCRAAPPGDAEGEFRVPTGIAVNQTTGHVYVVDRENHRVQEFDLDGNFVRLWGHDVSTVGGGFEICASDCRQGTPGSGNGQFGEVVSPGTESTDPAWGKVGIAVDPVSGDVFVADPGNSRLQRFAADGTFVAALGAPGTGLGEFGPNDPQRVVVDSNQIVYISDTNDSSRVQRYDAQAGTFLAPIACCSPDDPSAPLVSGITVGLDIDPDTDGAGADEEHLLVARLRSSEDTVVQELDIPDPATDPVTTVVDTHTYTADPSTNTVDLDRRVNGIGLDPATGNLYLVVPNIFAAASGQGSFTGCGGLNACSGLLVLAADVAPPSATIVAAEAESTSATITATANAGGGVATYVFQLSTDGGASWTDSDARGYVSGSDDVAVTGELTGLQPNTGYLVRLLLRKQTGFSTDATRASNELTFLTDIAAPDVETLGTAQRTDTSVRLRGRVDPNGLDTTYRFEYGRAGGPLDGRIPIPDAAVPPGNSPTLVTQDLQGLAPSTAYQYRIVAINDAGTSEGQLVGFTTEPAGAPVEQLGRGYELVSPADKASGVGAGSWYTGPDASALVGWGAHERERFAVQGYLGSVLVDGPYTYSNDWALAERTPDGWVSSPGISRRAHGSQAKADISLSAAADDLSVMTWASGGHTLKVFPEMETWDESFVGNVLMMSQWNDGWELFGPTDLEQIASLQDRIGDGPQAVAADGSAVVVSASNTRGLAGQGDPTNVAFPDLQSGSSVYLDEITGPFSDRFPGDDGVRTLVNVCTPGTVIPIRVGGDGSKQGAAPCPGPEDGRDARLISPHGASLSADGSTDRVISADGSRVFFMSPNPEPPLSACSGSGTDSVCPTQLYVWQRNPDGSTTTRWISRTQVTAANDAAADQDASLMAPVSFQGASRDGDKAFFRTTAPLTADDRNGAGAAPPGGVTTGDANAQSGDLYMYDAPGGPTDDPGGGDLVRISAGPDGSSDCNAPSGTLRYVSGDGSRVYFTCAAPLSGVPTSGSGTTTTPGGTRSSADAVNLYVYDAALPDAQRWRFIARLPTGGLGDCAATAAASCVNGTLDGSLVTFTTHGALTSDEAPGDESTGDVYAYDARQDELSRLSAPRDGAAGEAYSCGGSMCHGEGAMADRDFSPLNRLGVASRPNGDRLAFFQSQGKLVPEDTDGRYDVYQWRASDGALSLLSTGVRDDFDAMYVGNDRSGLNVYVATRDRLTWQDSDAVLDVYTARIGGGIPQPPGAPRCDVLGDACHAPGPPPRGSQINSDQPHAVAPVRRLRLKVLKPSARARKRAARTGVLSLRVRASRPGRLNVSARARLGRRVVKVAAARKRVAKAGTVTVKLRLRRAARQRLATGRALRLSVRVSATGASGAVTKTIDVTLRSSAR